MSALAPTLQAFFTERLIGQRQASPHTIAAYRDTFRLLLVFAQRHTGIAPHKLDIDDLDAPRDHSVPGPARARPGQQPQDPQPPAGRDPLALPLRRPPPSRARGHDRARVGDPGQTTRPRHRQLPHRARRQGAARRTRPRPLDRPPRPRPHDARHPAWPSKNERSRASPRSASNPAATDPPTRSSPSSRACDYPEHRRGVARPNRDFLSQLRITCGCA